MWSCGHGRPDLDGLQWELQQQSQSIRESNAVIIERESE